MKEIPVSVCISAHNAGKFLPRCLDSVVKQTLSPIEIVLVNNGSTDNSLEIMEDYKRKYPNIDILIVSQEDKGIAQGRQTGVNHAHGEFIAFLDADDYVLPNAYEKMYKAAIDNDVDIVEAESIWDGVVIGSTYTNVQKADKVFRDLLISRNAIQPMLWLRLYRKKLFDRGVFPNLYVVNEDVFAFPCLLYEATKIYFLKEVLHVYCTDNENAVMKPTSRMKDSMKEFNRHKILLKTVEHIWNFVGKDKILQNYHEEIKGYVVSKIIHFIYSDCRDISYSQRIATVCEEFAYFNTTRDVELYVSENLHLSCNLYRCIKLFGLKLTFLIFQLSKRYRNKSSRS